MICLYMNNCRGYQIMNFESRSSSGHKQPEQDLAQLLYFYEQNLGKMKHLLVQKDEEIKTKDERVLEGGILVSLMLNKFQKIIEVLEHEKQEIVQRYIAAMDQIAEMAHNHSSQLEQKEREWILGQKQQLQVQQLMQPELERELYELRMQNNLLKSNGVNLEVRLKEMEVKLEEQKLRLNEAYVRIDYLEKEKSVLQQQNGMFEQQFKNLLQQFENYQEISKKRSLGSLSGHSMDSDNSDMLSTYSQFKKQGSHNSFQHQQVQQGQQKAHSGGIQNFPSEYRSQSVLDLEQQLTAQLQELTERKSQLESELNKKITISKSNAEKKKREMMDQELTQIIDQINKVKLKLRENKLI